MSLSLDALEAWEAETTQLTITPVVQCCPLPSMDQCRRVGVLRKGDHGVGTQT